MSESRQQPASDNPPSGKGLWAKAQSINRGLQVTTETFLSDYLDEVFLPQNGGKADRKYAQELRSAVKWLHIARVKRPRLRDLTRRKLTAMSQFMYESGYSHKWADKMLSRLSSLWRHAHDAGVLPRYTPFKTPARPEPQHPFLAAPPVMGTVRHFYIHEVRIGLRYPFLIRNCDTTVSNLDVTFGRFVRVREVKNLLPDYSRALVLQGQSDAQVKLHTASLNLVLDKWETRKRRRYPRMEPLPEAEVGTFRRFYEEKYRPQRMIDVSRKHLEDMDRAVRYLHEHYQRDISLRDITDNTFASHFAWLQNVKGLSNVTINSHRGILFAVWRHAYDRREVSELPRLKKLRIERNEPDSWNPAELAQLIKATDVMKSHRRWSGPIPAEKWWSAFLLVAYWTGLRAGSLRTIQLKDVDIASRFIYIQPRNMKTRRGKRFRIGSDAATALGEIMDPPRDLLFPFAFGRRALWGQFRKIQKAAGLAHNGRSMSRLHKLRRSVATQAAVNAGMAAAIALLDHSGPEVTKRYLDPSKLPGADATKFLPALELGEK